LADGNPGNARDVAAMIAIYPDRDTAEAVAAELRARHHVPDSVVHVGEPADAHREVVAEMDEEVAQGWASGIHGFTTAQMTRNALIFGTIGAAIGAVLGLPIGYFLFDHADAALTRLGIGALIGLLFGSVVGALVGGGLGAESPAEPLAGERGVPVRVDEAPAELEAVLEQYQPIRIDKFEDGQRVATPVTDRASGITESVQALEANAKDPRRRS